MANRPHVPKFGDWNNQDQPFTVVFDNARTNKRQDLYESIEKPEAKPQTQAPPPDPQPARRNQRPEPPKPVKQDTPRATDRNNRARAPLPDQLHAAGGGRGGGGSAGGLYGGYGGGGGSVGNQRQPPAPRPPQQPKKGGGNGRGATIPPFPGSVGAGENMSYTHIFDQVKEERNREGGRSYGGTSSNTPSRPINDQRESPAPNSSKVCCFPWYRKGTKY